MTFLIFSPNTRIKTGVGIIGTTEGQKGNLFIATGKLKINAIMGLKWIFFSLIIVEVCKKKKIKLREGE